MGQSVNHTVQCVLVLNVFMEKTFMLLWGWYTVLAFVTLANISTWFEFFFEFLRGEIILKSRPKPFN
jgi:innexin